MAPLEVALVDHCDRGLSLSVIGRYREAIEFFDRSLEANPSPEAAYNRAVARARLDGVADAVEDLEAAEQELEKTENPLVRQYGFAGIRAVRGDAREALSSLAEAIAADPATARRWARSDPAWADLRDDPAFESLLAHRRS